MQTHNRIFLSFGFFIFLFSSCNENPFKRPAFSKRGYLNAVIEIPAGSNKKMEFDRSKEKFKKDRDIKYLSYPLNYGFIPSTNMDIQKGGDGDPLDIIVLAESIETGTMMEVIPIGLLMMTDSSELDHKVIAIPADPSKRIIESKNFKDFSKQYSSIIKILDIWFKNYDPEDHKEMLGWKDEEAAKLEVKKWIIH